MPAGDRRDRRDADRGYGLGSQTPTRRQGKALHAAREPQPMLEQIRRTIGEYNFAGQYQQAPSPLGGGLVKAAWFRQYAVEETPQFERVVQSWDTGSKATELDPHPSLPRMRGREG